MESDDFWVMATQGRSQPKCYNQGFSDGFGPTGIAPRAVSAKEGGLLFWWCRWCNPGHITIKDRICRPDIELLAVGLGPYYLLREILHAIVVAVYIPPSANPTSACEVIHSAVAGLKTEHLNALIIISGDFNHVCTLTLTKFTQYVTCKTIGERTLDLLYANVKDAYSSSPLPLLGRSNHNFVHFTPAMCLWWKSSLWSKIQWGDGQRRPMRNYRPVLRWLTGMHWMWPARAGHGLAYRVHHELYKHLCGLHCPNKDCLL